RRARGVPCPTTTPGSDRPVTTTHVPPERATPPTAMSPAAAQADLTRIVESAKRLGVELDEVEALHWLTAAAAPDHAQEALAAPGTGGLGPRVTRPGSTPADRPHFRPVGDIVGRRDPPAVETALALSGSAAQSKVQSYPGDCDYFE